MNWGSFKVRLGNGQLYLKMIAKLSGLKTIPRNILMQLNEYNLLYLLIKLNFYFKDI